MIDICAKQNFTQLITKPARNNLKHPENSTLSDIILTNAPHKHTALLSDHCSIARISDTKLPKLCPHIITKIHFRTFNEQHVLCDLGL
jgi:hypothetical protein